MSRQFIHPDLGPVVMTVRSNCRSLRATRLPDHVRLSVPPGVSVDEIMRFLDRCASRFHTPPDAPRYYSGQRIECPDVTFVISSQSHKPLSILVTPRLPETYIEVGSGLDLTAPDVTRSVSLMLSRAASRLAAGLLIPRAQMIASQLGAYPSQWKISSGKCRLGYCSHTREIALSCTLIFMPEELRDYIICHELAHLTEMNHSPRFHALCDVYCGGREKELIARLKSWRNPVI